MHAVINCTEAFLCLSLGTRLADVVIVVLSQSNPYHADRARKLQIDLMEQMLDMPRHDKPNVYLTHRKWPTIGTWTVFPLLQKFVLRFTHCMQIFNCAKLLQQNMIINRTK